MNLFAILANRSPFDIPRTLQYKLLIRITDNWLWQLLYRYMNINFWNLVAFLTYSSRLIPTDIGSDLNIRTLIITLLYPAIRVSKNENPSLGPHKVSAPGMRPPFCAVCSLLQKLKTPEQPSQWWPPHVLLHRQTGARTRDKGDPRIRGRQSDLLGHREETQKRRKLCKSQMFWKNMYVAPTH